jgi:hypothetical protein
VCVYIYIVPVFLEVLKDFLISLVDFYYVINKLIILVLDSH